jgi:acyl-CoA reductase-like NAD-dependent aldehyde dehydrogenase
MTVPTLWKTYKLYIGGAFPRSESGRVLPGPRRPDGGVARIAQASRKDMRNAVQAARKAQPSWSQSTATLRGQIAYRLAEMVASRRETFVAALLSDDTSLERAEREVDATIDRIIWWAGWSDKYETLLGSVNPVAGPFVNWSRTEPTGVVAILGSPNAPLLSLISVLLPSLISGNASVVLVPIEAGVVAMELAEALATSDIPAGVVNVLTARISELVPHVGSHEDIDACVAIDLPIDAIRTLESEGAHNLKRCHFLGDGDGEAWYGEASATPWLLHSFVEIKTTWHTHGN